MSKRTLHALAVLLCMLLLMAPAAFAAETDTWDCATDGHYYEWVDDVEGTQGQKVIKAGDCDTKGITKNVCGICGKTTYTSAYVHEFEDAVIPATCTEPEMVGVFCTICGEAQGEVITMAPALGHAELVWDADWVCECGAKTCATAHEAVEPTCEKAGYGRMYCPQCEGEEVYEEIGKLAALGHKLSEEPIEGLEYVDATCTEASAQVYMCERCEEEQKIYFTEADGAAYEAAKGHKYDEDKDVVEVEATCKTKAYSYVICEECEEEVVLTEGSIDSEAHKAVLSGDPLKAATCTTTGIGKYVCELCEKNLGYKVIPAAHQWALYLDENHGIVFPTCGEDGWHDEICTECGEIVRNIVDPATGEHNYVEQSFNATCTENEGAGEVCTVCGDIGKVGIEIEDTALGHDTFFVADCGCEEDEECEHECVAPTCTKEGYGTILCDRCDYSYTGVIEATGHKYDYEDENWSELHDEADCENPAGVYYICKNGCGIYDVDEFEGELAAPALGHDWQYVKTVAATCMEKGYDLEECANCHETQEVNETAIDPENHVVKLANELKVHTCTTDGIGKYVCENEKCTYSAYKVVPAAHNFAAEGEYTAPTCGKDGSQIWYCTELCVDEDDNPVYKTQIIPATGEHIFEESWKPATCTEPEMVGMICNTCGATEGEMEITGDALGHAALEFDAGWTDACEGECTHTYAPATCEKDGYGRMYCPVCNEHEVTGVLAATGHKWEEESDIVVDADCENPAGIAYDCLNGCGAVKVEPFTEEDLAAPALGHDWKYVETVAATCMEKGYDLEKCANDDCGKTRKVNETAIDPENHETEGVKTLKDATCDANGIEKVACINPECDYEAYQVVPADHEWANLDDAEENVAATCVPGVQVQICKKGCVDAEGNTVTRTIATEAVAEHDYVESAQEATCTEPAKAGLICSECHGTKGEMVEVGEPAGHEFNDKAYEPSEEEKEELGEDWADHFFKEPTCTEEGFIVIQCDNCEETTTVVIEALGHVTEEVDMEADCLLPTRVALICEVCDEEVDYVVVEGGDPAKGGHNMEEVEVAGNCAEVGYRAMKCTECGYEEKIEGSETETNAANHVKAKDEAGEPIVKVILKEATCYQNGILSFQCVECEKTFYEAYYLEHTWSEEQYDEKNHYVYKECEVEKCGAIEVIKYLCEDGNDHLAEQIPAVAPSCTETGLTAGEKCSACGEILVAQEVVAATGHTEETVAAVAATCTATGLTEGKKCTVCGEITVAQEVVAATGHTEETVAAVAATCTATGLTEGKKCTVCGEITVAQEVVEMAAHTEVTGEAKEANCTEAGYTAAVTCSVCEAVLTESEAIEAKGHTEVTGEAKEATCTEAGYTAAVTCSVCEAVLTESVAVEAKGHTEVTGEAKEATCTEAGYTATVTCSVCEAVLTESVAVEAKGHTEVTGEAKEATCTEAGYTAAVTCSVCEAVLTESVAVEAKGHTIVEDAAVEATCTETGLTAGEHCTACDYVVAQEEVPAKGHTIVEDAAVEANCTETGLTAGEHCTACDYVVAQEEVPAKGHTIVEDAAVEATCTETGLTAGEHCTACDYVVAQEVVPATGHSLTVSYDFNEDYTGKVKTTTCSKCDHKEVENLPLD